MDRLKRGRAVAALIRLGWNPPTPTPEQTERIIDDMRRLSGGLTLTPSQSRVLELAADGHTHNEVAEITGWSFETVKDLLETARLKLGARNTTHGVALAIRQGLIEAPK